MTIEGSGERLEECLKRTKASLTKAQLGVEVIERSSKRVDVDGELRERAHAFLADVKTIIVQTKEGIEGVERSLHDADVEQRELLGTSLVKIEASLVKTQENIMVVRESLNNDELTSALQRDRRRDGRFRRLNAAATLARFEYKFYLLLTMSIVAVFFLFFFRRAVALPFVERQSLGGHIIASLICGWGTAKLLRLSYLSRKLLKKYDEKQLREMWLSHGGFSDE